MNAGRIEPGHVTRRPTISKRPPDWTRSMPLEDVENDTTEELVEIIANDPKVAEVLEARKRESGTRSEETGADKPRRLH